MAIRRYNTPLAYAFDAVGVTIPNAKLNFYITDTTDRKDTFTDETADTANDNPVEANSDGRFPDIFTSTDIAYKVVYTDADDVEIWTADPYTEGSDVVSVKDFGATGDGATDDTTAVQAALDAGAGAVYFPAGTYLCDDLDLSTGATLYGDGIDSTIKASSNVTRFIEGDTVSGVELRDLSIDGNKAVATSGTNLVYFDLSTNITLTRVEIKNSKGIGLAVKQTGQNGTSTFLNVNGCWIHANDQHGINIDGCSICTVSDNFIYSNTLNGINGNGDAENINNTLTVTGNYLSNNGHHGLLLNFLDNDQTSTGRKRMFTGVTVADNICISNGTDDADPGTGLSVIATDATVTGNVCKTNYASGIWCAVSTGTVSGNTSKQNYDHGIDAAMANTFTISGNNCTTNGTSGINVEKATKGTVSGNVCNFNGSDAQRIALGGSAYTAFKRPGIWVIAGLTGDGSGSTQDITITGNTVNSGTNQAYGIQVLDRSGGTCTNIKISDNVVRATSGQAVTITGITKANPGVVTATAHGFINGEVVFIKGVATMTEVNTKFFTVANKADDTFEIVDTSGFTDPGTGGTATLVGDIIDDSAGSSVWISNNVTDESSPITTAFASVDPLVIPPTGETFEITGQVDINTISSADAKIGFGRKITLIFSNAAPGDIIDGGGNVQITGGANFNPSQYDAIDLTWDGARWVG